MANSTDSMTSQPSTTRSSTSDSLTRSSGSIYITSIVSTASVLSPTTYPLASSHTCPDHGGVYSDTIGHLFNITCGSEVVYSDLLAVRNDTLSNCMLACADYVPNELVEQGASCVAINFVATHPGLNCYLKYEVTEINYGNKGIECAVRLGYLPANPPQSVSFNQGVPSITGLPTTSPFASSQTSVWTHPPPSSVYGASPTPSAQLSPAYSSYSTSGSQKSSTSNGFETTSLTSSQLSSAISPSHGSVTTSIAASNCSNGPSATTSIYDSNSPSTISPTYVSSAGSLYSSDFTTYILSTISSTVLQSASASSYSSSNLMPSSAGQSSVAWSTSSGYDSSTTPSTVYQSASASSYSSSDLMSPSAGQPSVAWSTSSTYDTTSSTVYQSASASSYSSGSILSSVSQPPVAWSTSSSYDSSTTSSPTTQSSPTSSTTSWLGYTSDSTSSSASHFSAFTSETSPNYSTSTNAFPTSQSSIPSPVASISYSSSTESLSMSQSAIPSMWTGSSSAYWAASTTATSSSQTPTQSSSNDPANSSSLTCLGNNNTDYTARQTTFHIRCGDSKATDLRPTHADSADGCAYFCAMSSECDAFTYVDSNDPQSSTCYPKANFQAFISDPYDLVSGAVDNSSQTGLGSPDSICPAYDGVQYDTPDYVYNVTCNATVTSGTALVTALVDSFLACLFYCDMYRSCAAVGFNPATTDPNAPNCAPYSSTGGPSASPGLHLAIRAV